MDPLRPLRASSATAAMSEHAVANATANMIAGQQRNGMHRAINVHGRLMYDEIVINDVWINAVLSTLALSCAACVCLCFLYCKFQQWKHAAQRRRNLKKSQKQDDSLPSYTIVTGLPTYDEALERMSFSSSPSADKTAFAVNSPSISVVRVKNEIRSAPMIPPVHSSAKLDNRKAYGLVSHRLYSHANGCQHCLSVKELLETYNVR